MDAHQGGGQATSGSPLRHGQRGRRAAAGHGRGVRAHPAAGSRAAGTPVRQLPPTWALAAPRGGDVDTTFRCWTFGAAKDARVELLPREFQLALRRDPGITGRPGRSAASADPRGGEAFRLKK